MGHFTSTASKLKQTLRALRHRNFRLFFVGQGISLVGTWLTRIATSWLVYRMTGSAFLLGLVGFAGQIPTLLLAPLGGVFADRWDRRRVLVITQALSMSQSFMLAALSLSGVIQVWQVFVLSIYQGLINAFDTPVRQAFVIEMVEGGEDLANAIALNSSMFNAARLLGPSLAGILIASTGEGACFLIDGISYIAVIWSLVAMRLGAGEPREPGKAIWHEMREGFGYVFGLPPIRAILLLVALVSLMGMPYTVVLPVFAKDILHGGPKLLGFLAASAGVGALAGALYMASRTSVLGLGKVIAAAGCLFGLALIAFSLCRVPWLSLCLMLLAGFGMMVQLASCNTIIQTLTDDDKRGRVMSLYTMAFLGMAPFGSIFAGLLASRIGAPGTVLLGGVCCVLGALGFAWNLPRLRETARPIYVRKGILPELARGIQSATQFTEVPKK